MSETRLLQSPATDPQTDIPPSPEVQAEASARKIKDRRPQLSGRFYAQPIELRLYGPRLGLSITDRAVVETIDQLPAHWDATYASIAEAAGCSEATVKRVIKKLGPKLITRRVVRYRRTNTSGVQYDLTPLWDRLAKEAQNEAPDQIDPAPGQIEPRGGQIDLPPIENVFREKSRSGGSSAGVARAREASSETTTTTQRQIVGTRATTDQLRLIAELAEERAVEARDVETRDEANHEIHRLKPLPRAKQASCADCGDAFTKGPDDADETRCPPCAQQAYEQERQQREAVLARSARRHEQQQEQRARRVQAWQADGLTPDQAAEAAHLEALRGHRMTRVEIRAQILAADDIPGFGQLDKIPFVRMS